MTQKLARVRNPRAIALLRTAFLSAMAECGTVWESCQRSGASLDHHKMWLNDDPEYPMALELAKAAHADRLEAELIRRGVEGVPKGVWYKGQLVGHEQEYSDTALLAALRAKHPAYKEQKMMDMTFNLAEKTILTIIQQQVVAPPPDV